MIGDDPRTLVAGSTGPVWARVTSRLGADLTGIAFQLRTVDPDGVISSWVAPSDLDDSQAATGMLRASLDHVAEADALGWWELQAKLGEEIVKCGPFLVVAA